MTVAVVVHVDADRPYVDSLRLKLEGVRLVACVVQPKTPIMAFDERLPLILVWSKRAAAADAGARLAAMAKAHVGETIVCAADETPLPGPLTRLSAGVVDGSPRSSFFPNGLLAALAEAQRRQLSASAGRAVVPAAAASRRAFTEGVARGLAGSVAVFGVGGAAALGVEQMTEINGFAEEPTFVAEAPDPSFLTPASFDDGEAVQAEAAVIYVDPATRDVPLAEPGPEAVARVQMAVAAVADRPFERAPGLSDAEVVAALNRVESMRIAELGAGAPDASQPLIGVSQETGGAIVAAEASTI